MKKNNTPTPSPSTIKIPTPAPSTIKTNTPTPAPTKPFLDKYSPTCSGMFIDI